MSESQGATAEELQVAMRLAPATVAVITAESDGDINGLTATSFCSVSMEPPSILVCVNRDSRTHGLISASQRFCVNLLGAGQQGIANAFASTKPGEEKLKQADTSIIKIDEMPVLEEASANMTCDLVHALDAGSHTIFVGTVRSVVVSEGSEPLLYGIQQYGSFVGE